MGTEMDIVELISSHMDLVNILHNLSKFTVPSGVFK